MHQRNTRLRASAKVWDAPRIEPQRFPRNHSNESIRSRQAKMQPRALMRKCCSGWNASRPRCFCWCGNGPSRTGTRRPKSRAHRPRRVHRTGVVPARPNPRGEAGLWTGPVARVDHLACGTDPVPQRGPATPRQTRLKAPAAPRSGSSADIGPPFLRSRVPPIRRSAAGRFSSRRSSNRSCGERRATP